MSNTSRMVCDRLWQIKKAATEIKQLCKEGRITCEKCPIVDVETAYIRMCAHIGRVAGMAIDEEAMN